MDIRKITTRPGFEFIFAAGIAAIFIIPSAVMAQTSKTMEITVSNGDTVVNGKNIKQLTPQQHAEALKDLEALKPLHDPIKVTDVVIVRTDKTNDLALPPPPPGAPQYGDYTGGRKDRPLRVKRRIDSSFTYSFKFDDGNRKMDAPGMNMPRMMRFDGMRGDRMMGFNSRNSQTYNYSTTDGAGVTTRINYRLTDADHDVTNELSLADIKLVPDFMSGKTTLMFDLPGKGAATVEFMNSEGKVLWSERSASAMFVKSFPLALNGHYQLKVKQGGKVAVKDIFKEE